MNNRSFKKLFAPSLAVATLLLGMQAGAARYTGSVERLFNACQQELQTYCSRQDEPREAFMCLRDNEGRLFTRSCANEMNMIERTYKNIPLPSEEPYRLPQETNDVQ